MKRCRLVAHAARLLSLLAVFGLPSLAEAGTDANGFFDSYLVALGYDAAGAAPADAQLGEDYLCDGEVNEDTILPDEFTVLLPPVTAADVALDPGLCGSKPAALRGFDTDALLDLDGNLPIVVQTVNNTTLDFRGMVRTATGNNSLTPSNIMAYA